MTRINLDWHQFNYLCEVYRKNLETMKLTIKNLGKIESCQLELNNLTILVGDNNSGKPMLLIAHMEH